MPDKQDVEAAVLRRVARGYLLRTHQVARNGADQTFYGFAVREKL